MESDDDFFGSLSVFDQPAISLAEWDKKAAQREHDEENANLWAEKYRPKMMKEMIGNVEVCSTILALAKKFCDNESENNAFLLKGYPGVGKTTSVGVVVNELIQERLVLLKNHPHLLPISKHDDPNAIHLVKQEIFREINGSDSRTLELLSPALEFIRNYSAVAKACRIPKIVLIDECDEMEDPCYKLLLSEIKLWQKNDQGNSTFKVGTLFFFTCNDDSKIPDELKNHTFCFSFKKPGLEDMQLAFENLIKSEQLIISDCPSHKNEWIAEVLYNCGGDFRQFYSMMEAIHMQSPTLNLQLMREYSLHVGIPLSIMHQLWQILYNGPSCSHAKIAKRPGPNNSCILCNKWKSSHPFNLISVEAPANILIHCQICKYLEQNPKDDACEHCSKAFFIVAIDQLINRKYGYEDLFDYWIRYLQSQPFTFLDPGVYDQIVVVTYKSKNDASVAGFTITQWHSLLSKIYLILHYNARP